MTLDMSVIYYRHLELWHRYDRIQWIRQALLSSALELIVIQQHQVCLQVV